MRRNLLALAVAVGLTIGAAPAASADWISDLGTIKRNVGVVKRVGAGTPVHAPVIKRKVRTARTTGSGTVVYTWRTVVIKRGVVGR